MHRLLSYLLFLVCLPAAALTTKDIDNVHVADRTRYVSDMAGAMSAPARARADSLLQSIWRQTSAEPVVVIVPSLDGEDIDDFATRLFSDWRIGKNDRDSGVLMLISIGDRQAVIRTGYGAEGVLPDVVCARIIRNEMRPRFREGDYDGGILASLQTMQAAMTSDEAARLVKWVIDMALGPAASGVLVEPMRNYPPSGKMPLIIGVAGVQQHLFWFYPQQPFEEMCETLSAMLKEIPVTCDSVPA